MDRERGCICPTGKTLKKTLGCEIEDDVAETRFWQTARGTNSIASAKYEVCIPSCRI